VQHFYHVRGFPGARFNETCPLIVLQPVKRVLADDGHASGLPCKVGHNPLWLWKETPPQDVRLKLTGVKFKDAIMGGMKHGH
jgi:hypothetical protein